MTETKQIFACVHPSIIALAGKLFPGTEAGREIELYQNARRAGASKLSITNHKLSDNLYKVVVEDDGSGIRNWNKLLELGGSSWSEAIRESEYPAGMGLFSMCDRTVTIESLDHSVVIDKNVWEGRTGVSLKKRSGGRLSGTRITFEAPKAWGQSSRVIDYLPMTVIVDGKVSEGESFFPECDSDNHGHIVELLDFGVRVYIGDGSGSGVNFFGHTIEKRFRYDEHLFHLRDDEDDELAKKIFDICQVLVELTGDPTDLCLMLPARTRLYHNDAFYDLSKTLLRECCKHIARVDNHSLPYSVYQFAQKIGCPIPEAKPTYSKTSAWSDVSWNSRGSVSSKDLERDFSKGVTGGAYVSDRGIAQIFEFADTPPMHQPVHVSSEFTQYSWYRKFLNVSDLKFRLGNLKFVSELNSCHRLFVADDLHVTMTLSDGFVYNCGLSCLMSDWLDGADVASSLTEEELDELVRKQAVILRAPVNINDLPMVKLFHMTGSYCEDSERDYDTQLEDFESDFIYPLFGSVDRRHELSRQALVSQCRDLVYRVDDHSGIGGPDEWSINVDHSGSVTIKYSSNGHTACVPIHVAESVLEFDKFKEHA